MHRATVPDEPALTMPPRGYNGVITHMKRIFVVSRRGCSPPLLPASCKHAPPANVAAEVNGHPITYTELDKIYQSQYPQHVRGRQRRPDHDAEAGTAAAA